MSNPNLMLTGLESVAKWESMTFLWVSGFSVGVGLIIWGAELFAEHLAGASRQLHVSQFALALLLAGAEPEELATAVTAAIRHAPGIALGDVIGANVTICLVALGAGSIIAPLPFGKKVTSYGLLALPLGLTCALFTLDGLVTRIEGACLVALYATYVAIIWILERHPPSLGEIGGLEEAEQGGGRVGRSLLLALIGIAAMAVGSTLLVAAAERFAHTEASQTRLGLTVVGFATGFELVVLAISVARRGATQAAIAAVVGSYAYNVTMTLGAAALAHPLELRDASLLHWPMAAMLIALGLVLLLAAPRGRLTRPAGLLLLAAYPLFLWLALRS